MFRKSLYHPVYHISDTMTLEIMPARQRRADDPTALWAIHEPRERKVQ